MIIVKFKGGLGNQMFQYAYGRTIAKQTNKILMLDFEFYKRNELRQREIQYFNILENSLSYKKTYSIKFNYFLAHIPFFKKFANLLIIKENRYQKSSCPLTSYDYIILDGYWQSEKFFKDAVNIIKKDFQLKEDLSEQNKLIRDKILKCNSVSIHIRRGDYISNKKTNKYHGICDFNYYKKAIEHILYRQEGTIFFMFSDDLEILRSWQNKFSANIVIIDGNNRGKDIEDMVLMSLCKHNIIANSTFSWWAAWLNLNANKLIISPRKWYNNSNIDTSDLIPIGWVKL